MGAIYAPGSYQTVEAHPAVLFLTGANDPRVDPMHSRKMTAMLQAASVSNKLILLRTSSDTGHGGGTPLTERIEQTAHIYAFLFDTLNVEYKPVLVHNTSLYPAVLIFTQEDIACIAMLP